MAVLGLCCWVWAFSSCSGRGLLFLAVRRLLTVVASLVVEHRLQACGLQQLWHLGSVVVARGLQSTVSVVAVYGLSSFGARAQLLRSMWDLPGPGLEPMSPVLAGGFLTTVPRGKPSVSPLANASRCCLDSDPTGGIPDLIPGATLPRTGRGQESFLQIKILWKMISKMGQEYRYDWQLPGPPQEVICEITSRSFYTFKSN